MPRHTHKGSKSRKIHKRNTRKNTVRKSKSKSKSIFLKGGNISDELALVNYLKNNIKKSNNIIKRNEEFQKLSNEHLTKCSLEVLGTKPPPEECNKIADNIQISKKNLSKTFVGLIVNLLLGKVKDIVKLYKKKKNLSTLLQFIVDLKLYTSYFIEKESNSSNLKYNNLINGISLNRDKFKEETSKTLFDYFDNEINNKQTTSAICRSDSACITYVDKIKKMNETLYKSMKPEIYLSYSVELISILKEFLNRK